MLEGFMDTLRSGFREYDDEDEMEQDYECHGKKFEDYSDIMLTKPKKVKDSKEIIDYLMQGSYVAINLESAKENEKQRIMDMVSGYCYGHNCHIEKVNRNIFIASHTKIHTEEY